MPIAKWGIVLESRLVVQKNGWKTKCLSIVLLQGSLIWLFCETTLNVIHIPAKLANLIFFSFLLNCATSYLSINLDSDLVLSLQELDPVEDGVLLLPPEVPRPLGRSVVLGAPLPVLVVLRRLGHRLLPQPPGTGTGSPESGIKSHWILLGQILKFRICDSWIMKRNCKLLGMGRHIDLCR